VLSIGSGAGLLCDGASEDGPENACVRYELPARDQLPLRNVRSARGVGWSAVVVEVARVDEFVMFQEGSEMSMWSARDLRSHRDFSRPVGSA
jgi:hypothetical protein